MTDDTRDHTKVEGELEGEARRLFTQAVLNDLRALERMLADKMFEVGVPRIGAEQELFLVDRAYHPSPGALKVLERIGDPHFTTELALFNLEMNADPQPFGGKGLSTMEGQLVGLFERLRVVCGELELIPVLIGILPTIDKNDLGLDNMVPSPRYLALNRATTAMRGEAYDLAIKGIDELIIKHDTVMVESCNASFQVHLQVDPDDFARLYNLAQALTGPVLSVATNSPILFGKRLWNETRIAVFEQAVDTRQKTLHMRDRQARVTFGKRWVHKSIVEIYKEDVARFRTLVGTDLDEDALDLVEQGKVPQLKALRLHNGTVYRWNRACYGVGPNGRPHLRIELRVLPSGPTIPDEIANAALWLGLMSELGATLEDVTKRMEFDEARANLYAAARDGMGARLTWLDGEEVLAQTLILDRLLPLAKSGLDRAGVDPADSERYLHIVEQRARTMRSGARWALRSLAEMKERASMGEKLNAIVAATVARQMTGRTVSEWERARLDEVGSAKSSYHKVSQYMTTDIFTVQADDAVELVADLMGWERIRHVPVEDGKGHLVGLVSYRAVLRYFSERAKKGGADPRAKTSVSDIMRRDVMTITPDTPTLEAIRLMRRYRIGCLPVVQHGQLVAIVTEQDFMNIASELLEHKLGGQ
ncbi:MAG: CBS domain-containing protein [Sandaracinaceae bacterium]|nr:CBS domain-containing protein [Sandaracinaceae bacterium]